MSTHSGFGDLPTIQDELGFGPSALALAEIVQGAHLDDTPLTIGIYGPWGSGKTSIMKMIYEPFNNSAAPHPEVIPIWFDAWRYAQSEALWRALLISVIAEIRLRVLGNEDRLRTLVGARARKAGEVPPADPTTKCGELEQQLDDLLASLYQTVEREEVGSLALDWGEAGKATARTAIRMGLSALPFVGTVSDALGVIGKAVQGGGLKSEELEGFAKALRRERSKVYSEQVRSLEQFYRQFHDLIEAWAAQAGFRLVIFIDDLDRCLPEQAIGVLEAIKVFFDAKGCIFVLGVDREIIERGIRVRYKEFALTEKVTEPFPVAERDYLEKIVQVPFTLPPLAADTISTFLQKRLPGVSDLSEVERTQVASAMTAGLLRNPRKVKRSFNIFRLHLMLDRAHQRRTPAGLIAKLTVIQTSFTKLYEQIAREPLLLRHIEAIVRGMPGGVGGSPIPTTLREEVGQQDDRLRKMLQHEPWFAELDENQIHELVYQSRVSEQG
ncbi:hypothetical protein EYB53_007240 [Candidatus Chloroploca sp. M-50]|uniref:KAP NTPase domain-containing protein n=1 Tax=Candidatus Chloroploca mongolica TaxID=2528176 RepID=A0ABS4D7S4_9CHLR|nr:P-loop NTPase fold protein [Candidatus Chloroploca mongolica]MBP1465496.1 hypothetical protein [Candidatus Chloroploca mongolica]